MDRAKLLDKIQKCLALSKSPNEHEAAAALRQAQKMMERHGVTENELGAIGFTGAKVHCPIQAGKKVPAALGRLVHLIQSAFGVKAVVTREVRVTDKSFTIHYFGPEHRVMLAEYSHDVVYRAMERAWTVYVKERPYLKGERGARAGFQIGWLETVAETVTDFGMTEDETVGTDLVMGEAYGTLTKTKVNNQRIDGGTYESGRAQGENFKLHRPMGGTELKKLT